ncbi:MAG: DUF167 domain-containing protein [Spirochaetaceae bacterium]|nr:DUF167 domain-containing protein [Spirochaetaceae bacterium]
MDLPFEVREDAVYLDVKAVPGASKTGLADVRSGRLRIRVAAAAEDGKANAALTAFLAKTLNCQKSAVWISSGEKSRLKTLRLPLAALEKLKAVTG